MRGEAMGDAGGESVRRVVVEGGVDSLHSYRAWQRLYMHPVTGWLLPDTEVWHGETLLLRINSLGCKGKNLDPATPVLAIFGASDVFGISTADTSWPQTISIPGVQLLNAGIEGHTLQRNLEWYRLLSKQVNFAGVVLSAGWHNIVYDQIGEAFWGTIFDAFRGDHLFAIATLATPLIDECIVRGLEPLLHTDVPRRDLACYFEYNREDDGGRYFNFWCDMEPTRDQISAVLRGVQRFNDFVHRYCASRGIPVVDLHTLLRSKSYEEVPTRFYDVLHPRPAVHPQIGSFVAQQVGGPLAGFLERRPEKRWPLAKASGGEKEDFRKNLYPLW
jgi:hypothetical protein